MEVNSEGVNIAAAEESVQGTLPSTGWRNLEADAIGDPGPAYKKERRNPFTITRQLRRTFVAGLDCALALDVDAIKDHIDIFGEAIFKSDWKHSGGTGESLHRPTAAVDGAGSEDSFTVTADGDYPDGSLVVTRGFTNDENNDVFVTTGTSTTTAVKVATGTLVAEASPPANATLDFAGFQFAAGDLELDADGNLTSTTKTLTDLGLQVGQLVYLPSSEEVDPPYCFTNDEYHGFAEVVLVETNKITLRDRGWTVGAATTETTTTIRLFFTKWVRNVARSHADEKLVSHSFEVTYPGLAAGPADAYEYLKGYVLNMATFQFPAEGKVSLQLTFIGKTADDPTASRESGPDSALDVVTSLPIATSADIKRLFVQNVDESGLMTDFANLNIALNNNVQAVKAVGHLGNRFTPLGTFEATTDAEVFFTDPDIVTCVRDNRILRLGAGGRNTDFGLVLSLPSTGAMQAPKTISHNELVKINSQIAGFMDATRQYTASMSVFAYLPTLAPGLET